MSKLKASIVLFAVVILLAGCNLTPVKEITQNENLNSAPVANLNEPESVANQIVDFDLISGNDGQLLKVEKSATKQVYIADLATFCNGQTMFYAQPENSMKVILQDFNPGMGGQFRTLYLLDLAAKKCQQLNSFNNVEDFGARALSPDKTKLAVALETNEARQLKVIDLLNDTAKVLVNLPAGETLNGGYGAHLDDFRISWFDNYKIQYTVFNDTVKDYAANIPDHSEEVKEVRVVEVK